MMASSWRRCSLLLPLLISSPTAKAAAFRPHQPLHYLRSSSSSSFVSSSGTRRSSEQSSTQPRTPRLLSIMSAATTAASAAVHVIPGRPTWQQTMLRIKDPKKVSSDPPFLYYTNRISIPDMSFFSSSWQSLMITWLIFGSFYHVYHSRLPFTRIYSA
jgi:hypothetical protein